MIRSCAFLFLCEYSLFEIRLDVLVNNAGVRGEPQKASESDLTRYVYRHSL